jgi:hypothetical protein
MIDEDHYQSDATENIDAGVAFRTSNGPGLCFDPLHGPCHLRFGNWTLTHDAHREVSQIVTTAATYFIATGEPKSRDRCFRKEKCCVAS